MRICIDTEQVDTAGKQFISTSDSLAEIGHELQSAIGSLDTWAWDGVSRQRAEPLLSRVRPESERVAQELEELGYKLVQIAEAFEQEDNTAANNLAGMSWVDFEVPQAGVMAALGVATLTELPATGDASVSQVGYDAMTWQQRWDERADLADEARRAQEALDKWNQEHENELDGLTLEQVEEYLKHLDKLEAEAEQNIHDIQHPDGFLNWLANQISDADEKYIEVNEEMLRRIREDWRPRWEARRDLFLERRALELQLDRARQNQTNFDNMLRADIPPQSGNLYRVAGCVKYVMEDTYVPWDDHIGQLNASNWLNLAQQHQDMGVRIYDTPQPGDIIWFEPNSGTQYQIPGAGHVAIVDSVNPNTGEFVYREASTKYRSDGTYIVGDRTEASYHNPTTMEKLGNAGYGVKFIRLPWTDLYPPPQQIA